MLTRHLWTAALLLTVLASGCASGWHSRRCCGTPEVVSASPIVAPVPVATPAPCPCAPATVPAVPAAPAAVVPAAPAAPAVPAYSAPVVTPGCGIRR